MTMHDYPEAFTTDQLTDIIDANEHAPDTVASDHIERLLDIARARADARGEDSALDSEQVEALICAEWQDPIGGGFGYSGGKKNIWAFGILEAAVSRTKGATLFTSTQVAQQDWLDSGDGRKTQLDTYLDSEYDNASPGDLWIPDGALDYMAVVVLSPELLHGDAGAADAM